MTREEIDILWQKAMHDSVKDGEQFTRYHFARAIADLQKEKDAQLCDRYAADYAVVGAGAYAYMEEGARSCAAGIRSPETDLEEAQRRQ